MKVKDVKRIIKELQCEYNNMIKLQEYFMGHSGIPAEVIKTSKENIENGANLSMPVRDLCLALH